MLILNILILIFLLYILITTSYLSIVTVAAYFFKKKTGIVACPLGIACIVPAHNEELQIQEVIQSLRETEYPKECYTIIILADNCSDQTALLAKEAGTRVLERHDMEHQGKGYALDWIFRNHQEIFADVDAIAIIDADTRTDRNFLTEISASLSHPDVEVVQGYYDVRNPADNWRTGLCAAALTVFHHLRPAGRSVIGGTAGLQGNGMAFRARILQRYGWPAHSVVEDLEFSLLLLRENILVHYNPDAVVYAEMAVNGSQAESQRRRWESGRLRMLQTFGPWLLRACLGERRIQFWDGFMELLTPPLSLLVLGQIILLSVSMLFYPHLTMLPLLCILVTICYVFSGLILRKAPLSVWLALLSAPLFMLWKIPLYIKIITRQHDNRWKRTRRNAELNKNDGNT